MERNAYFDNARLLLIFLVVFGHMIQPFVSDSIGLETFYTWLYTFHMPAFIFLAGFFAKGSWNLGYITTLVKKLLVPYVVFQIMYTIYYLFIGKENWLTESIFYPHWSLWFLFSLFSWHILLIGFKKLPAKIGIFVALLIGVIIGYFDQVGHLFSVSRTFVFLPFFLIGYWTSIEQIKTLKKPAMKIAASVIMIAVAFGVYYLPDINTGWLLASKSYGTLGVNVYGGVARTLVYGTSLLMAMSFLIWIPSRKFSFTSLGTRTLYVYLLHGFFIQYFRQVDWFKVDSIFDVFGIAVLSALIVVLLSSDFVTMIWKPIIEGKLSYPYKRKVLHEKSG